MFYLKYLAMHGYRIFKQRKTQSSLCQCTAPPELSLLALNERKKIGKFGICRILKHAQTHLTITARINEKKSGKLVFVAF